MVLVWLVPSDDVVHGSGAYSTATSKRRVEVTAMALTAKTAAALGYQFREPATMTREQAVNYFGARQIFEDVVEAGWLSPCATKKARRAASGRGRGDTCLYATQDVYKASHRLVTEGYPQSKTAAV